MKKCKGVKLIAVPYDSGHFNKRMGAGPLFLLRHDITGKLQRHGFNCSAEIISVEPGFRTEIATTFQILEQIKSTVARSAEINQLPIILSGNCNGTIGVMAGLKQDKTALIWFDAHGDCETPDTTISGFLDGCSLSMLTGNGFRESVRKVMGNRKVEGKNVLLIGTRDLSDHEGSI